GGQAAHRRPLRPRHLLGSVSIVVQWQAMHRDPGRPIGTPHTASREEVVDRAARLPGGVRHNLTSGDVADVVHALSSAPDRYLNGWADIEAATDALKAH